jgi:hypothetical protein
MSSLDRDQLPSPAASVVSQAESALIAGENLLGGLLDISLEGARKRSKSGSGRIVNRSPPSSSCSLATEASTANRELQLCRLFRPATIAAGAAKLSF